jgi:hypothetical protein
VQHLILPTRWVWGVGVVGHDWCSGLINSMWMFSLLGVSLLLLGVCACLLPPITTCLMRHPRPKP